MAQLVIAWEWINNSISQFIVYEIHCPNPPWVEMALWSSGSHLNMRLSSYKCIDPHVKDKTASPPSYFSMGIQYMGKTAFNLKRGPGLYPYIFYLNQR